MHGTELQLFNPREQNATSIRSPIRNPQKSLEETLNSIFPNHQEETKIQKARRILGEVATDVTDERMEIFLTEVQYLLDTWFDNFEKDIFEGLTLKQVLKER